MGDFVEISNRLVNINSDSEKYIFVFWHQKMLPAWYFLSKINSIAIVSLSKDGEVLSKILSKWGVKTIRGSSSKGGKEALENLMIASEKHHLLITPDGPRGPIFEFKAGAVIVSARKQKEIVLVGVNIHNKYVFKRSWDKFQFPMPFTKIDITLDKTDAAKSDERHYINDYLIEMKNQLDIFNE